MRRRLRPGLGKMRFGSIGPPDARYWQTQFAAVWKFRIAIFSWSAYSLYLEGTRSRTGEMTRFRPGLGALVAETTVPVNPCYLSGCFGALCPEYKRPRMSPITVRVGKPLTFEAVKNDREGWIQIAAETEAAVRELVPAWSQRL